MSGIKEAPNKVQRERFGGVDASPGQFVRSAGDQEKPTCDEEALKPGLNIFGHDTIDKNEDEDHAELRL